MDIDRTDRRILKELQRDGRMANAELAQRVGLCTIGRATNRRFLCFSAPERLLWQPELAGTPADA